MTVLRRTVDIDARLLATTQAYKDAIDRGDFDGADVLYLELDEVLDARLHVPQQRGEVY